MKTLNRPMFRYGGPIKEGVMNGIREPKRNGGSMTQRVQPSNDGSRPGYAGPLLALPALGAAAMRIAPAVVRYGKPLLQGAKRIFGKTTPASVTRGSKLTKAQAIKEFGKGSGRATNITMNPSKFDPNYLGRDPIVRSVGAIGKGIFSPTSKGVVAKAARFATAPSSVVAGVAYYMWPDGKERNAPPPNKKDGVNTPSGNNPFGYEDDVKTTPEGEKALTTEEVKALENKTRNEQMDRYREIIDIKGMNKDAAYKSLIDVSKIIQEGGNLKKSLKDGSLIQKVTAAASKRFDKVSDTENALRSLVAKGEIDNEMNKETKALDKKYKEGVIAMNQKKMSGPTLLESINEYVVKNKKPPSGNNLATLIVGKGGVVEDVVDTMLVDKHIKAGGDSVSFMESIVAKNLEKGEIVPAGTYVVKDSIVVVDENGNVTSPYKIS